MDDLLDVEGRDDTSRDEEFITRGEFKRMTRVVLQRLARVEELCFEDSEDRPSLSTFISTMDKHRQVMCAWARGLRTIAKLVAAMAAGAGSILLLLHELGVHLPWLG